MKQLLLTALLLITVFGYAQENQGIQFEKGLSWEQIKVRAKAENKYIFVDVYTTWCGPCKQMEQEIYPLSTVGAFYNAHFINVKAQLDTSKKDNDEVKAWYKDARQIKETYQITAFPTYLYLDPSGQIVHKAV